jgi:hypothetical protein
MSWCTAAGGDTAIGWLETRIAPNRNDGHGAMRSQVREP